MLGALLEGGGPEAGGVSILLGGEVTFLCRGTWHWWMETLGTLRKLCLRQAPGTCAVRQ